MTPTRQGDRRRGDPPLFDQEAESGAGPRPPRSRRAIRRARRSSLRAVPLAEPFDQELAAPPAVAALPMDPRIRRRRVEVRRDERRHRRRVLLACLAVAAVLAGAAGATRSPLLDVDRVVVVGAERTARSEVIAAGKLGSSPAMLDVDTASVARRLQALPWVLEARARREWPATIRVDLVERRPAAVLPAGEGAWALADGAGRVLAVGAEKPAGLPVLGAVPAPGGPGTAVPDEARPSLAVAAALPGDLRPRIADVATVPGGEVELQLVPPGGVVRLGTPVDLDAKLGVVTTILLKVDLAGVAVIDVRVPRAPVLTRR